MQKQQEHATVPLTLFYAYAQEDERFRLGLEKHLSALRRQGLIAEWYDRKILPGSDVAQTVDGHLLTAQVILLLISPDFLASDYWTDERLQHVLERQAKGETQVIPILIRPVDWEGSPFAHLQYLPRDGKPVTGWTDRDAAFATIARELRNVIKAWNTSTSFDQASHTATVPSRQQSRQLTASIDQNRRRMLERVRRMWITGVLEHSLHGAALMVLGLGEKADVLDNPWRLLMQEVDRPAQLLPEGTRITEVYNPTEGRLLILGEPGAGKTTLLLELARDLLNHAQASENAPIPVVFNLSSWAKKRLTLSDWLVEELNIRYEVPRRLGQSWVSEDRLLLLLDGLDEVASTVRKECIEALNSYRRTHPDVQVVVCSRSDEYLNESVQLRLHTAVVIQPLTQAQIDTYLESAGEQAEALREALRQDADLRELMTTPLMLTILLVAYRGTSPDKISELTSLEAKQEQIFASYVQHMLKRRGVPTRYTSEQIMHWLSWLARQMREQDQTVFYVEQLHPDLLSGNHMLHIYNWLAVRLPSVLMSMFFSLAIHLFIFNFDDPVFYIGPVLMGGLLGGILSEESSVQRSAANGGRAKNSSRYRLLRRLVVSTLIGLGIGLSDWLVGLGAIDLLIVGLGYGICSFLLQVLLEKYNTVESLSRTPSSVWRIAWHLIRSTGVRNGLLVGLLIGLSDGLTRWLSSLANGLSFYLSIFGLADGLRSYWLNNGLSDGLSLGLADGLSVGLTYGLVGGFLSVLLIGRSVAVQPTDRLTWSWRRLERGLLSKSHISMALWVMALFGLEEGLTSVLFPVDGLSNGLSRVLSVGLGYWFLLGLFQAVSGETIEDQKRMVPNQGIRRSAFNGLVLGSISATIMGLSYWLNYWLNYWLGVQANSGNYNITLSNGISIALGVGLFVGLLNGGLAWIRHYVLRCLIWSVGAIPWNYIWFLDYSAERILLRKVGGGYIFMHRLLLDYFANLDAQTVSPSPGTRTMPSSHP